MASIPFSAIICLIIGFAFDAVGLMFIIKYNKLKTWLRLPAKIVHREIRTSKTADADTAPGYRLEPYVKYQYELNSQTYENDKIALIRKIGSEAWAQKALLAIPDDVLAYVNPEKPTESYLFKSSVWFAYLFFAIGFVVTALGALLIVTEV